MAVFTSLSLGFGSHLSPSRRASTYRITRQGATAMSPIATSRHARTGTRVPRKERGTTDASTFPRLVTAHDLDGPNRACATGALATAVRSATVLCVDGVLNDARAHQRRCLETHVPRLLRERSIRHLPADSESDLLTLDCDYLPQSPARGASRRFTQITPEQPSGLYRQRAPRGIELASDRPREWRPRRQPSSRSTPPPRGRRPPRPLRPPPASTPALSIDAS